MYDDMRYLVLLLFLTTYCQKVQSNAEIIGAFSGGSADFSSVKEVQQKLIPIIERELD